MIPLDAVSDALNKILDKAQQYAPTVWEAALHQVAINARISFMWGVGWSVAAGIFALIGLGVPVFYFAEKRQVRKISDNIGALVALNKDSDTAIVTYDVRDALQRFRNDINPNQNLPFTAWASIVAWIIVVVAGSIALSSFWNAWQMSQNPTWWAIQLIKG